MSSNDDWMDEPSTEELIDIVARVDAANYPSEKSTERAIDALKELGLL